MARDYNKKVNWEFRKKMTDDLLFMVEKRVDRMRQKYGDKVSLHLFTTPYPPRIQITLLCETNEQGVEFGKMLDELDMFTVRVYPSTTLDEEKRIFVVEYMYDKYSYKESK